ncbi:MAG TPA: DoxX family protein [Rhizomicrobium sp.]|jgi:putative oxidoreductase|nr:DoxX family protein [Rhizomicrobium sp.]
MLEDLGKLVVRLGVGGLLLLHGAHKLLTGIADVKPLVTAAHLPEFVAYGVYLGEIAGPILVILGLFSRVGGMLIVADMVAAIALAGAASLFQLNAFGGYALELETFYLLGGLSVALLGAGRLGFNLGGRWN